jgi:hypothetical protein
VVPSLSPQKTVNVVIDGNLFRLMSSAAMEFSLRKRKGISPQSSLNFLGILLVQPIEILIGIKIGAKFP